MGRGEKKKRLEGQISGLVVYGEPLGKYTSFGLGGPADVMVFPQGLEDVQAALSLCRQDGMPYLVLGGGSNLLVRDGGFRGMVLHIGGVFLHLEADEGRVRAGAGVRLSRLVAFCSKLALAGMESLAGVPGTIGGAVRGNAGAFGGSISDHLTAVRLVTREGNECLLARDRLEFSYRRSLLPEGCVVFETAYELTPGDPVQIRRRVSETLLQRNRQQPVEWRSAGSVFQNPPGDYAGRLVEKAGLKGVRIGGACISPKHGNFIINLGGATAADILALVDLMRDRVREELGVELELEVRVVGEP
ncbi:MAG: UDP-N-acetylmuramate dehydrogenase [Candidatus Methylomirabilales bacterium]